MKILLLVNWKIEYTQYRPDDKQPPDYVIPNEKYWFFKYFSNDIEVKVVDMHSYPLLEKIEKNNLRFYIWQTIKVLPYLGHFDIVLSHGMQSGIMLCMLRRIFGKGKFKHIIFDIGAFNSAKETGKALKIMQYAGKSLDGLIYHTKEQYFYYQRIHPWLLEKAEYIPYGVDVDFFQPLSFEENQDMKRYVLCIGYQKRDWDTLLKAYEKIKTDIVLKLVGAPAEYGMNIKQYRNVDLCPPVSIQELKRLIAGSLFGILPLKDYNYSFGQMTLLQQMSMGKAVIVADVPSIREYIGEGVFVYKPEDAEDLRNKIQQLIYSEEVTEAGQRAAERVRVDYNEKIMAQRIQTFIERILYETDN